METLYRGIRPVFIELAKLEVSCDPVAGVVDLRFHSTAKPRETQGVPGIARAGAKVSGVV
jgi:hypothetical protein